uniref:Uncharacterized protein n=1 Tax=Trichinella nativa TaxID=6335 RepID=A0A0V1IJW3_9BILA
MKGLPMSDFPIILLAAINSLSTKFCPQALCAAAEICMSTAMGKPI